MVRRVLSAKLGVHGHGHLKGEPVSRGQAVSKDDSNNEAARAGVPIFNCHVTPVYEGLLLGVPLGVDA